MAKTHGALKQEPFFEAAPLAAAEEESLVAVILRADRRKSIARSIVQATAAGFGAKRARKGILDTFHGETGFGLADTAAKELRDRWEHLLSETARLTEDDGASYDKHTPRILQELSAKRLFPTIGVVRPEEVVLAPYSSTLLLEEALATVARPGGVVLSPEGFYKSNALHVAKQGLHLRTFPLASGREFKLDAETLRSAIQREKERGTLSAVLLTIPGNPVLAEYAPSEMAALAQVIVDEDVRVICDAAFEQMLPAYKPLAALTVRKNGRVVRLYDRVLTIAGNSKGFNAFGPCKFGAACSGDADWLDRLRQRLTVAFQRETTYLIRAVLEQTSDSYFAANRARMQRQQELAKAALAKLSAHRPTPAFHLLGQSTYGMFLNLELDVELCRRAGITSSVEWEEMLLLSQGVEAAAFARMGSRRIALRFNIVAPRKNGTKDAAFLEELVERLGEFVREVEGGLTLRQLLDRSGPALAGR